MTAAPPDGTADAGSTETAAALDVHMEVTTTLSANFTGGFERLVRSVLTGLEEPAAGASLNLIPVTWNGSGYRRLTDSESEFLHSHPPGGTNRRRADRFGALTPALRRVAAVPGVGTAREYMKNQRRRWSISPTLKALAMKMPEWGSVWFDLEPSWNNPEPRGELLTRLRAEGVNTAVLVADVMPELHPEWFDPDQVRRFGAWLQAHLEHSALFVCISQTTARDLVAVARRRGISRELNTVVIPLGADGPDRAPVPVDLPPRIGQFLLTVGTLEPRKNHTVLLDVFDRLSERHADLGLVIVGRQGWLTEQLADRIRNHALYGKRLVWPDSVTDAQLAWLYQHAYLTVAPSLYEGLGVPVMEALRHGSPTMCSTGGALPEAGAGCTEEFDPTDVDGLCVQIERHLLDRAHHDELAAKAARYTAPSWDDSAAAVGDALRSLMDLSPIDTPPRGTRRGNLPHGAGPRQEGTE
jgi:glycosyltransferase involved in cell wall biosynthesis